MKQLKERGLVEYTQYSPVLTKTGRHEADRVISCHQLVEIPDDGASYGRTLARMKWPHGIEHIISGGNFRFQLLTDHVRKCREVMNSIAGEAPMKGGFAKEPSVRVVGVNISLSAGSAFPGLESSQTWLAPGALA